METVTTYQLAVCGAVTMMALVLGFIYTYFRRKGMKFLSTMSEATESKAARNWLVGWYI